MPSTSFFEKSAVIFARASLFLVYFWFGILKLFSISPANPLVGDLLEATMPFLTFEQFIIGFSIFEMIIGILFLVPKLTRFATVLFGMHMVMTAMPLVILSQISWQKFFVPTLEGQYIIKNLLLISTVMFINALDPGRRQKIYQ